MLKIIGNYLSSQCCYRRLCTIKEKDHTYKKEEDIPQKDNTDA